VLDGCCGCFRRGGSDAGGSSRRRCVPNTLQHFPPLPAMPLHSSGRLVARHAPCRRAIRSPLSSSQPSSLFTMTRLDPLDAAGSRGLVSKAGSLNAGPGGASWSRGAAPAGTAPKKKSERLQCLDAVRAMDTRSRYSLSLSLSHFLLTGARHGLGWLAAAGARAQRDADGLRRQRRRVVPGLDRPLTVGCRPSRRLCHAALPVHGRRLHGCAAAHHRASPHAIPHHSYPHGLPSLSSSVSAVFRFRCSIYISLTCACAARSLLDEKVHRPGAQVEDSLPHHKTLRARLPHPR
jgi:hypothetical protein